MIRLEDFTKIYLHRNIVDFRKSINGLSEIVVDEMRLNAMDKLLFVFTNRGRNRLKVLYWDNTGFALWYKRLEKDKFPWPKDEETNEIEVEAEKLRLMLEGYNVWEYRAHKKLNYSQVN